MDENIIKSYLISLGYTIDKGSEKKSADELKSFVSALNNVKISLAVDDKSISKSIEDLRNKVVKSTLDGVTFKGAAASRAINVNNTISGTAFRRVAGEAVNDRPTLSSVSFDRPQRTIPINDRNINPKGETLGINQSRLNAIASRVRGMRNDFNAIRGGNTGAMGGGGFGGGIPTGMMGGLSIGSAITAGIFSAVSSYADDFEKAFRAGQRSNSSAREVISVNQAGEQVGVSGVSDMIENMVYGIKTKGTGGILSKLIGQDVTKLSGIEAFSKLIDKFKELTPVIRSGYSELVGLDPKAMEQLVLNSGKFQEVLSKMNESNKSIGDAAASSVEFNNATRDLNNTFTALKGNLSDLVLPTMTGFIGMLNGVAGALKVTTDYFTGKPVKSLKNGVQTDTEFTPYPNKKIAPQIPPVNIKALEGAVNYTPQLPPAMQAKYEQNVKRGEVIPAMQPPMINNTNITINGNVEDRHVKEIDKRIEERNASIAKNVSTKAK